MGKFSLKLLAFGFLIISLTAGCFAPQTENNPPIVLKPVNDNMNIGAYYYPWYSANPMRHWNEGYNGHPSLGEYSSRSETVINKHIELAVNNGIDFFLVSWWGKYSFEDITFKDYILKASLAPQMKFAILYETGGLLSLNSNNNFDLSLSTNVTNLKNDFIYLSRYFSANNYLKIDGKPVVFLYLTRIFTGDAETALNQVRAAIRNLGFELYLIADQVYWQDPNTMGEKNFMRLFEAVTAYNMHTGDSQIDVNFVGKVSNKYNEWYQVTSNLNIDFIPDVMPGFHNSDVNAPVIVRTEGKFTDFCREARKYLSPKNLVLITSWNEWHEYTQIEPEVDDGGVYLNIVRNELAGYK